VGKLRREGGKERGTNRKCEWVLVHAPVFERRILRIIYSPVNNNGIIMSFIHSMMIG
jgi:hypothetical protein